MDVKTFSVGECFSVGWARFKERPGFLMSVTALVYISAVFFSYLTENVYQGIEPTRSVLDFFSSLLFYWLYFGMIVITLKLIDGVTAQWTDLFVFDRRFLPYILGSILYGLVVVVGGVFLIIPGIYLALRYGFFWYAIIDGRKGVFDAFHESARITHGVKWNLILFGFACFGITLLGLLCFGIGILVALPVVTLASTHLYRVLLNQSKEAVVEAPLPVTPERPAETMVPVPPVTVSTEALAPAIKPSAAAKPIA